jgi:excisionase family DNA binding protein
LSNRELRALAIHTVPRAVEYARERLNDPTISESKFRHWIAEGKVRFHRFGGTYSFVFDELDEDLAGRAA